MPISLRYGQGRPHTMQEATVFMSTFSVGGLASGLDTKTVISQLMQIEGRSKTKLQWQSELLKLRTQTWRDLNTRISTLKGTADQLLRFETWDPNAAPTGTGSWAATSADPARLSATVTGTPTAATHLINVLQLSEAQVSRSSGALGTPTSGRRDSGVFQRNGGSPALSTTGLTSLRTAANTATGLNTNSVITLNYTVNGISQSADFKLNTAANGGDGTRLSDLATWVANTVGNGASASIVNGQIRVTTAPGTANELTAMSFSAVNSVGTSLPNFNSLAGASSSQAVAAFDGGATANDTLTITSGSNSWNVAVAMGDDKQAIVNKINATSGIGVFASLAGGEIELRSTTSGASSGFNITSSGSLSSQLGFSTTQAAQDAQFTVDGTSYSSATNTGITTAIAGVSLNLLGTTNTTLQVGQGTGGQTPQEAWASSVASKVEAFVKAYNDVHGFVYQKTQAETRVTTPANRSTGMTMSEYLSGPMARNSEFSKVAMDLRRVITDPYSGLPSGENMLADIGISTQFKIGSAATNGQLSFDADKFKAALLADPAKVQEVLSNAGGGAGITNDDGFMRRISEQAVNIDSMLDDKFKWNLDPTAKRLQDQIDRADVRLTQRQAYYERMFSSMEKMLGSLQSQGSWLSGQISAMSGSKG